MELRDALTQISEIRTHMARTQVFKGYRSATAAFSGIVAVAGAFLQGVWIPDPRQAMLQYALFWGAAATLSLLVVGVEMVVRSRLGCSTVQAQLTILAAEQFLPAVVAGALLTATCVGFVPELFWALPGLWMFLFALGVFASCRLLPRATFFVGGFYLLAGVLYFILHKEWQLTPLAMGLAFGLGQFLTAVILYFSLERGHGRA